uniref:NADH-ubiquinone oxidoreductase chain 2 n=1 Tax=Thyreophagus entomophagus TaxID=2874286 RepID=A0A977KCL1_9ACAR|nr:NADH dehydrogenase subunit 2 [Thyreophagus entomophagus]UXD78891.1 NADH dehydrogenase subunit 2 [Thyreophagus entomophagus]
MLWALILSTILAICSSNWTMIWMCLEINALIMCFLMTKTIEKNSLKTTPTFLYFCVQVLTSIMMILMISKENTTLHLMVIIFLLMKMGSWPFHGWYLTLFNSMELSQPPLFIIMTWQKVIPMVMIFNIYMEWKTSLMLMMMAMGTLVVPLIYMKKNMSLKTLLALSSLNNNGWLLMTIFCSKKLAFLFLLFYALSLLWMVELTKKMKTKKNMNPSSSLTVTLIVSNMGGIPPMTMFWAKTSTVKFLMNEKFFQIISMILVMSACYLLYFYLTMLMSEIMKTPLKTLNPKMKVMKLMNMKIMLMSMSSFLLI